MQWVIRVPLLECSTPRLKCSTQKPLKCSTRAAKGPPQKYKGIVCEVLPRKRKAPEEDPKEPLRHASRDPLTPTKMSVALAPDGPQGVKGSTPQKVEKKVSQVNEWSPSFKLPQKLVAALPAPSGFGPSPPQSHKVANEADVAPASKIDVPPAPDHSERLFPTWVGKKLDAHGKQIFGCTWCAACAAAGTAPIDAFARFQERSDSFFRPSSFRRHAGTNFHKAAKKAFLAKDDETLDSVGAPPAKEFVAAWRTLGVRRRSDQVQARRRKLNTLEWCLWQALRDDERKFLRTADTVSIQMDERKARTLLTYAACQGTRVPRDVLAHYRHVNREAEDIARLVHKAVRHFCFFRQQHASTNSARSKPRLDKRAQRNIIHRIEMFSADGASAEQLAGRLLHPRVEREGAVEKLPRLKMILRDKAHSVRRLTQRTFKVDPVLTNILDELVTGVKPIAQMLHQSEPIAKVFWAELKRQERASAAPGDRVRDLSWAKHRFDGVAKPLGVCMWNLDAVISTCTIVERGVNFKVEYRNSSRKFLDGLGPEKIILMGMMADASDEVLVLCRFFDREAFEAEQMAHQIVPFKARMRLLFHDEACLSRGYTRVALKFLEQPRMVQTRTGVKQFGGPSSDLSAVTRSCLQRMVAWSVLAEEVANTEFPDFELLGAFQVFKLHFRDVGLTTRRGCLPPEVAEEEDITFGSSCLQHLAEAFDADPSQLQTEFMDHRPLAQAEKQQHPELSAVAVWQRTLDKTQANWHSKQRWPAKALLPIVQRFFLCPGSTAGIEQKFSQHQRMMGAQYNASALVEERHFVSKVNAEATEEPPPGLVAAARRIWVKSFGQSRTTTGRATLGVRTTLKKTRAKSQGGASAWLAQRRRELGEAVATQKPCPSGTPRLLTARDKGPNNAAWTKEHEAELQHQKNERCKRACAATEEGTAKVSAVSAKEFENFREAERKAASALATKRRRQLAIRAVPKRMSLKGERVFVDESALQELDKPAGAWAALRRKWGLTSVLERQQASIIVVSNPAEPGDRNGVVASMLGLRLCTPSFLASRQGSALRLQMALRVPRYIFISPACQAKHTRILDVMRSVSRGEKKSRWLFFEPSTETIFSRAARREGKHKEEMVTLVVPTERVTFAKYPGLQTVREFSRLIRKPLWQSSHLGYCER